MKSIKGMVLLLLMILPLVVGCSSSNNVEEAFLEISGEGWTYPGGEKKNYTVDAEFKPFQDGSYIRTTEATLTPVENLYRDLKMEDFYVLSSTDLVFPLYYHPDYTEVGDGVDMEAFLYEGEALPRLDVQYKWTGVEGLMLLHSISLAE